MTQKSQGNQNNQNNQNKKMRVAVLYGGRSGEHEVSLRSAASVIRNLDPNRFEVVPVAIDKEGRWHLNDISLINESLKSGALPVLKDAPLVVLPPNPAGADTSLMPLGAGSSVRSASIDVVFPVMHGTNCEDGTIQGLLELAEIAYVGPGVLGSAVGMDKEVAKRLVRDAGLPIVPYVCAKQDYWKKNKAAVATRVEKELGYPVFVKPSNAGSSVGVHKVKEASQLEAALADAFRYDIKVLIEKAVNAREIELAALENSDPAGEPLISLPGEVAPTHEFYSYEAKYLDENGAALMIPAKLTPEQTAKAQALARTAFMALDLEGLSRVDLFLDKGTGEFFFNEVNTLPGFTSISMYPKMWEATGIPYQELLSRLIDLALARHARKSALLREFKAE